MLIIKFINSHALIKFIKLIINIIIFYELIEDPFLRPSKAVPKLPSRCGVGQEISAAAGKDDFDRNRAFHLLDLLPNPYLRHS